MHNLASGGGCFLTDIDSAIMNCEPAWEFSLEGQNLIISVASGKEFIKKCALKVPSERYSAAHPRSALNVRSAGILTNLLLKRNMRTKIKVNPIPIPAIFKKRMKVISSW